MSEHTSTEILYMNSIFAINISLQITLKSITAYQDQYHVVFLDTVYFVLPILFSSSFFSFHFHFLYVVIYNDLQQDGFKVCF